MVGTDIRKIKVNYFPHPFSLDKHVYYSDKHTIGEILKENGLIFTPDIVLLDGDKRVYGDKTIPQCDEIFLRYFPTGTGSQQQDIGIGEKVAGAAAIIGGIAITIASGGTLTPWAALLIGTGVSLFAGGVVLFNTQIPDLPEFKDTNNIPSLRGSKNATRNGGRIPILLGRHRVFPDNASAPYVNTIDDSGQELYQLFCAGLSNMEIDESTIKIGETDFDADSTGQSKTFTEAYYNIKYGESSAFTYYEGRRVDTGYNTKLVNDDTSDGAISITKTTPTNTRKFHVRLSFPRGLIKYDKDGDKENASVGVRVEYKPTGTADSNYTVIDADTSEATPTLKSTFGYVSGNDYISVSSNYYSKIKEGNVVSCGGLPGGTVVSSKQIIQTGYYPHTYSYRIFFNNSFSGTGSGTFIFSQAGTYAPTYTTITNKITQTYRKIFTYTLDNLTAGGSDYVSGRQYDIRVTRITKQKDSSKIIDDVYLESIKTENGVFDEVGGFDDSPIDSSVQDKLTLFETKIQASNQLQKIIDEINFVATVKAPVYSGTGTGAAQWATVTTTRNPASMFLMCLQNEYINQHPQHDSKIDWASLEAWYDFCDDKDFYCDAFINSDYVLADLLTLICATGRASWNLINGKYTIVIDDTRTDVIQMFTPRNSYNYTGARAFIDAPTALKFNFVNADNGYVAEERTVYKNDSSPDDTYTQSVQFFGVTDPDQAWKLGKYQLAVAELRPEIHSFETDIEYIVCTRGDRIKFQHDVPLVGIQSGRVISAIESGGNTIGFACDEYFPMEAATNYSVRFRQPDGSFLEKAVNNPGAGEYQSFTFTTPEAGTGVIEADTLVDFGETGSIDLDLIIVEISPGTQGRAKLTCVEYAPDIFDADSGVIPDYEPKINAPGSGDGGINTNNVPDTDTAIASVSVDLSAAYETLTARYPDSFTNNTATSYYFTQDDDYVYYVNYDDNGKIYKKLKNKVTNGEAITTDSAGPIAYYDGYLIYVNMDNGATLYRKSVNDADNGDQLTTDMAWCPTIDDDGTVFYINKDDSDKIYTTYYLNDAIAGDEFLDVNTVWCSAGSGYLLYTTDTGLLQSYDINAATSDEITTDIVNKFDVLDDDELVFTRMEDNIVYALNLDGTGDETALFLFAEYVNGLSGDLLYTSPTFDDEISASLSNNVVDVSVLEASTEYSTITGTITNGSNLVVDVDPLDMDRISRNDFLIATGIPDTAQVTLMGPTYFYMSENATATTSDLSIEVNGSRIFLNANKIISKGTIEAPLLTASAIDSKARTSGGFKKSQFDLDEGAIKLRADDDTVVFDFDPDRAGEELQITGTVTINSGSSGIGNLSDAGALAELDTVGKSQLQANIEPNVSIQGNYSAGSSGWAVFENGDAEFNDVTIRGQIGQGGLLGVQWSGPSESGTALTVSGASTSFPGAMTNNRICLADSGNDTITAYDWDGSSWSSVGSSLTITGMIAPTVDGLTGSQIAYVDTGLQSLRKYSFNGSSWSLVGSGLGVGALPTLTALNDTDVALASSSGTLTTYRFSGSSWSQVGNQLSLTVGGWANMTTLSDGVIAIADVSGSSTLRTYSFDGSNWVIVGNALSVSNGNKAISALNQSDIVYLNSSDDNILVYRFDGSDWSIVGSSGSTAISGSYVPALDTMNGTDFALFATNVNELRYYRLSYALSIPHYFQ